MKDQQNTPTNSPAEQPAPVVPETTDIAPKKRVSVVTVVAMAVLIALGLMAIGFFAYNAKDEPATTKPPTEAQTADVLDTTSPVDDQTIDTEVDQIDQTNTDLDNNSDFNESELSEANLGF